MPTIAAIIQYGEIGDVRVLDEPNLLVQSIAINPTREKGSWKGGNRATRALSYTDPLLTFQFTGIIVDIDGLCNQHPGTLVDSLENFTGNIYQYDPARGTTVFEDPSRSLSVENPGETEFSVVHHPFVGETDDGWEPPADPVIPEE